MASLPELIAKVRKEKKLTQKQVAHGIEMSERNYQDYEYGKVEPVASKLLAIADYFDVSVDYLLGRTDEPSLQNAKQTSPTIEEALESEGVTNPKNVEAIKNLVELMRKDELNAKASGEEMVRVFKAARSKDHTESGYVEVPRSMLDKIKAAKPVKSDDDI